MYHEDSIFGLTWLAGIGPRKISVSKYDVPTFGQQQRQGLLVKIEFSDSSVGFSDLMAWPELGDGNLQDELNHLLSLCRAPGQATGSALSRQVLRNSFLDAQARSKGELLWPKSLNKTARVQSHYLAGTIEDLQKSAELAALSKETAFASISDRVSCTDLAFNGVVKIKWTPALKAEHLVSSPFQFRIDFNERCDRDTLKSLLSDKQTLTKIDFVEDPFPHDDDASWMWLSDNFPDLKIYGDFALEKNPELLRWCKGAVLKPASRSVEKWLKSDREICITHSLGHPFGQMIAGCYSLRINKDCVTAGMRPTRRVLVSKLPAWEVGDRPDGAGFGYETSDLLSLDWSEQ